MYVIYARSSHAVIVDYFPSLSDDLYVIEMF